MNLYRFLLTSKSVLQNQKQISKTSSQSGPSTPTNNDAIYPVESLGKGCKDLYLSKQSTVKLLFSYDESLVDMMETFVNIYQILNKICNHDYNRKLYADKGLKSGFTNQVPAENNFHFPQFCV
ncbi:hypothetical protein TNIN_378791 [Trichonephila inaurata madagascariensis]|uniref:Uncharacterized protein n=1 Tax=Trichonephila inaurata madagascariensis TaxID=2747483 RepID=A0A8X6IFF4_9ARAC|nr:hypothetical protein TNIN_378791 [Trichonephila inaurata madagascariensis]